LLPIQGLYIDDADEHNSQCIVSNICRDLIQEA